MKFSNNYSRMIVGQVLLATVTFVFLFGLMNVDSNKMLLVVTALFGCVLYFLFRFSLLHSLFFVNLASLWIEKGLRSSNLTIVSAWIDEWVRGYTIYFGFSIKLIITIALGLLLVPVAKNFVDKRLSVLMLAVVALVTVSILHAPDQLLAFAGSVRMLQVVVLFFASLVVLQVAKNRLYAITLLISSAVFQSIIGLQQLLNQNVSPGFLSAAHGVREQGFFTYDGPLIFRTTGLFGHPTFFGAYLAMVFPFVLLLVFGVIIKLRYKLKKRRTLMLLLAVVAVALVAMAAYSSFSRSAWMSIASSCVSMLILFRSQAATSFRYGLLIAVIGIALTGLILSQPFKNRLFSIPQFFNSSSGEVRLKLLGEAKTMVIHQPLFGVGANHFVRKMNTKDLPPELLGFLYPVHNLPLLISTEMGLPVLLLLIILCCWSVKVLLKSKNSWEKIPVFLGILSFLISSQFHALYNQDATFELFFILLAWAHTLKT